MTSSGPSGSFAISSWRAASSGMFTPLRDRMRSKLFRPACSAGEPGATPTTAGLRTGWMPICPRSTEST